MKLIVQLFDSKHQPTFLTKHI